jgi:flagellin FlaB
MKFFRNEKGFTGLEAAIVLIAFVTVAAVFSYILLGAGFFATQKSQEVVHTGVKQATSSMEIVGTVVARGNDSGNGNYDKISNVTFTLQTAAGGQPIDLSRTLITVVVPANGKIAELKYSTTGANATHYNVTWIYTINGDNYLEELEKAEILVNLSQFEITPNTNFIIEVKPPIGATYPIELKAPPSIDNVMVLLR